MLPLTPGLTELEAEIKSLKTPELMTHRGALQTAGEEFQKSIAHRLRLIRLELERRGCAP